MDIQGMIYQEITFDKQFQLEVTEQADTMLHSRALIFMDQKRRH